VAQKVCEVVRQGHAQTEQDDSIQIYTLTELLALKFEKPPYFIEPLVPATGITLLAGASGSLKTAVIADLFLAIFENRLWLAHYVVPQVRRVLYLDGEIGHQALQDRLLSMGATPNDSLDYIYRSWRIENDKEFELLMSLIRNGSYDLILVDSISAMHNLEERTDTTVLVMKRLRMLADSVNCPIVVLANFNKTTSEKRELLERISGPSVYRNKSTAIITLRRFGGKKVMKARLQLQKNWFGQEGEARELELAEHDGKLSFTSEAWEPPSSEDSEEPDEGDNKQPNVSPVDAAEMQLFIKVSLFEKGDMLVFNDLVEDLRRIKGVTVETALATINSFIAKEILTEPERRGRGGTKVVYKC
jgi:hypothetical protein